MTSKKKIILAVVVTCVVAAGFGVYIFKNRSNDDQPTPAATLNSQLAKACDILTEDIAKSVLGGTVSKGDEAGSATSSSDDIAVSQCSYTQVSGETVVSADSVRSANLLIRSARTETGKQANYDAFSEGKTPQNVEIVEGYGTKAFWNPDFGQLNVFDEGNWYIIEFGSTIPSSRTLNDTKNFANTIVDKL